MTHQETVFVAETSYRKGQGVYEALSLSSPCRFESVVEDETALAAAIKKQNVRAFIADIHPYSGALYGALPAGGVICRFGVGHDSIDKAKASAAGIGVANTPGVLDNAVAEHALWLLGSMARNVPASHGSTLAGRWEPRRGVEVRGRSLAILGFGRIGRSVCRKAALGLEMRVIGVDLAEPEDFAKGLGMPLAQAKAELGFDRYTNNRAAALAEADFVLLLMAVTPQTKHVVNEAFLGLMKPGARLINSARGALIDEKALYDALASGRLTGAALDVFEAEPYLPQDPSKDLRTLANVVLTPHIGSNTEESNAAMAKASAETVIQALKNGVWTLPNLVNRPGA